MFQYSQYWLSFLFCIRPMCLCYFSLVSFFFHAFVVYLFIRIKWNEMNTVQRMADIVLSPRIEDPASISTVSPFVNRWDKMMSVMVMIMTVIYFLLLFVVEQFPFTELSSVFVWCLMKNLATAGWVWNHIEVRTLQCCNAVGWVTIRTSCLCKKSCWW